MIDRVRRWLLLAVVVLASTVVGAMAPSTTTVSAASYTYDVPSTTRVEVHEIGASGAGPAQFNAVGEGSAPQSHLARGASTTPMVSLVATNTVRSTSIVDDVIAETQAGARNLTSRYTLTADEALTAGERWVGSGYTEIGKPGSGVFRSADGTRQFRIDNGSITGAHSPGVPHVHLETVAPGSKVPVVNNHIPIAG